MGTTGKRADRPSHSDNARAFIGNCPKCDEPVVLANDNGLKATLSRFSIPYAHGQVLRKYKLMVWNIWHGAYISLYAVPWISSGRPSRGRLYVEHVCHLWR